MASLQLNIMAICNEVVRMCARVSIMNAVIRSMVHCVFLMVCLIIDMATIQQDIR